MAKYIHKLNEVDPVTLQGQATCGTVMDLDILTLTSYTCPSCIKVEQFSKTPQVTLYADGACYPNPGTGGYGTILSFGEHVRELADGYRWTTNNRMELLGVIAGLEALKRPCRVLAYSDSRYVVDGISQGWARGWRARDWVKRDGARALNPDLWGRLLTLTERHWVDLRWVPGHAGVAGNERADQLAVGQRQRRDLAPDPGYRK